MGKLEKVRGCHPDTLLYGGNEKHKNELLISHKPTKFALILCTSDQLGICKMSLLPSWTERAAEERKEAKSKNVCNFRLFIDSRIALHSFGTIVLWFVSWV